MAYRSELHSFLHNAGWKFSHHSWIHLPGGGRVRDTWWKHPKLNNGVFPWPAAQAEKLSNEAAAGDQHNACKMLRGEPAR